MTRIDGIEVLKILFAAVIVAVFFAMIGCDEATVKKPASGTTTYQPPSNGGDKIFVTAIELDGHRFFAVTTMNGCAAVHSPECEKCKVSNWRNMAYPTSTKAEEVK